MQNAAHDANVSEPEQGVGMGTFVSRSMLAVMLLVALGVALFVAVGTAGQDHAYISEADGPRKTRLPLRRSISPTAPST